MERRVSTNTGTWVVLLLVAGATAIGSGQAAATDVMCSSGESYWAGGREHDLLRVKGELTVCVKDDEGEDTLASLATAGGPLQGFRMVRNWDRGKATFAAPEAPSIDLDAKLAQVQAHNAVKWTSPTFLCADTASRLWVTDEVVVALHSEVSPGAVLGERFEGYRRLKGSANQYIVSTGEGATAALAAAGQLRLEAGVEWAEQEATNTNTQSTTRILETKLF